MKEHLALVGWVFLSQTTLWSEGSYWKSAPFFNAQQGHKALAVFDFFNPKL